MRFYKRIMTALENRQWLQFHEETKRNHRVRNAMSHFTGRNTIHGIQWAAISATNRNQRIYEVTDNDLSIALQIIVGIVRSFCVFGPLKILKTEISENPGLQWSVLWNNASPGRAFESATNGITVIIAPLCCKDDRLALQSRLDHLFESLPGSLANFGMFRLDEWLYSCVAGRESVKANNPGMLSVSYRCLG